MLKVIILAGAMFFPVIAGASAPKAEKDSAFSNGNDFYAFCGEGENRNFCVAFLNGFNAGAMSTALMNSMGRAKDFDEYQKKFVPYCLPSGVDAFQLLDVVILFLKNNPGQRHHALDLLTQRALMTAFPCPRE